MLYLFAITMSSWALTIAKQQGDPNGSSVKPSFAALRYPSRVLQVNTISASIRWEAFE
jgi:hypothetical protein